MVTPYLTFNGKCKDALDFYRAVFNCDEPKIMRYGDYMPEGSKTPPQLLREWVMHGEMVICGTNMWFADEAAPPIVGGSVRLSVTFVTGKEAAVIYDSLCNGGEITLPPIETFYSVFHAAVTDKFGVNWNVVAEEAPRGSKAMKNNVDSSKLTRQVYDMLDYVAVALDKSGLWERYHARPPYQQNDYIGWITQAKREETRHSRLAQTLDELRCGTEYMGMRYNAK
jgi:PhnB protein